MQGILTMDIFEIYIPKEAEVKIIPLRTLPISILRRIDVPHSKCNSTKSGSSPLVTWISPVVIRLRGCSPAYHTTDTIKMNLTSMVTKEQKDSQGPFLMSFVTSSPKAFGVLEEFLPSTRNIQLCPTQISPLLQGTTLCLQQDAIIINNGRIYLTIKKVKPVREGERHSPHQNTSAQVSPQTTQGKCMILSPAKKNLGKPTTDEPEETVLLRGFGLTHQVQVTLPRVSPADLEHQSATKHGQSGPVAQNTEQDQDKQELLSGIWSKETPERCFEQDVKKVTREEDEAMNVESEDSTSKSAHLGPLQSGQSWMVELPMVPILIPTPGQYFDFDQSARKERIDRIRAKLREREAALNNLRTT